MPTPEKLDTQAKRLTFATAWNHGATYRQLGKTFAMSMTTASNWRKRLGLKPRPKDYWRQYSSSKKFRKRLEETSDRLERMGFIPTKMTTQRLEQILLSPDTGYPAHKVRITSGVAMRKGSTRYTELDLFGRLNAFDYSFLVVDDGKFDRFKQSELATEIIRAFYQTNPEPSRGLRSAFTKYLHEYGIHAEHLPWEASP